MKKIILFGGGAVAVPLLLDSLSNVAAAYSFRKLRTAYAGSAVRIRRSSDNAEADIGFSGSAFDAAAAAAHIGGGSGFIAKWYDQSGNGRDAVNATATKQPQYVASVQNSKPGGLWDASNDGLAYAGAIISKPFTALAVCKLTAVTGAADTNPCIINEPLAINGATGALQIYAGAWRNSTVTVASGECFLYECDATGATIHVGKNGSRDTLSPFLMGDFAALELGYRNDAWASPYVFNGHFMECIFFSAVVAAGTYTACETDINAHYAIY